ncbi:MAG: helix-turn-helix domain-containing protein [Acidibacillus sp.]|nr:helix-turn-helix domain-containing protein [Acidibacillus sp.]
MGEKEFTDILQIEGVNAKGYGIIPKMVMKDVRLTMEAKAIYSYFCSYAGAGTQAFPSVPLILKDLNTSEKRYYRHFALLKKFGYIKTEQIKKEGKFAHTVYTLCTHPTPSSRFDCTEESPSSRFAWTQIGSTQNDGANSNSLLKATSIKSTDKQQQATPSPHQIVQDTPVLDNNQENAVVVSREEISTILQTSVPEKEFTRWFSTHGPEYIREKVDIVKAKSVPSPLRALRAAIRDNWVVEDTKTKKTLLGANAGATEHRRAVPAAQSGKYDRFYEIYRQRGEGK